MRRKRPHAAGGFATRLCRLRSVALACGAAFALPALAAPARAQSVGAVLGAVAGRVTGRGTDTSHAGRTGSRRPAPSATGTPIGAGSAAGTLADAGMGAAITFTAGPRVDGSDSVTARLVAGDTGAVTLPTRACGTARACAPGVAWHIDEIALPSDLLPPSGRVYVGVTVANGGRAPAPATALRLCLNGEWLAADACGAPLGMVALPALTPGARVRVGHVVELPHDQLAGAHIVAIVAPDRTTGLAHGGATASSRPLRAVGPELQWLAIEPGDAMSDGHLPVHLRVRNRNGVTPSPATTVRIDGILGSASWSQRARGRYEITLPALAPGGTWEADVSVATGLPYRCSRNAPPARTGVVRLYVERGVGQWGPAHQATAQSAPFKQPCA